VIWLTAGLSLGAGAILGVLYFGLLYRSVRLYASGAGTIRVVPLHMLRAALAVASFWIAAQQGAVPLLLTLSGFLVARFLVQCRSAAR